MTNPIKTVVPNWLRTIVTTQAEANKRVPLLLAQEATEYEVECVPRKEIVFAPWWLDQTEKEKMVYEPGGGAVVGHEFVVRAVTLLTVRGETGPDARPLHPDWVRALRDQAIAAGVRFRFLGWGEWVPRGRLTDDGPLPVDNDQTGIVNIHGNLRGIAFGSLTNHLCTFSDGSACEVVERVGAARAGRTLDGRIWEESPSVL